MRCCFTQPRSVSGTIATRSAIRRAAAFIDNVLSSATASTASRADRSRNSRGYFLGAGMILTVRGFRRSTKPGAVQPACRRFRLHYPGRNPLAGDHRGTHEYLAKIQPLIGERRHAHASSTTVSEATITPCSS
jgi:hypothetical protein